MEISFICNAGLMLRYADHTLTIDAPNSLCLPYYRLPDEEWKRICERENICGFFFTHDHPDHLDRTRLHQYLSEIDLPCFCPDADVSEGKIDIGPFTIEYHCFEHAPLPVVPPHVVALISAGETSVYIAADSKLDVSMHRNVLKGRRVDAAIWNAMYLSRTETRMLMNEVSDKNFVYHMPLKPDTSGIWNKCERNFERYRDQLKNVTVIGAYPTNIFV